MSDKQPQKKSGSKWKSFDDGKYNNGSYTPKFASYSGPKYSPKKAIKSFRDLEVYQKTMECSVLICAELIPILEKEKFSLVEGMRNCTLGIPMLVAEAHGMRFVSFDKAVATLESAMRGCNKMVVYLEQVQGLSHNADSTFVEDMSSRYMQVRGKMLRLEKSWQKFKGQVQN